MKEALDPDSPYYSAHTTHAIRKAHDLLTRHPGPSRVFVVIPGLLSSGVLAQATYGTGQAALTLYAAGAAIAAATFMQHWLRQKDHLPQMLSWAIGDFHLRRGRGNLIDLHNAEELQCEATRIHAGVSDTSHLAAAVSRRRNARRSIVDVEALIRAVAPKTLPEGQVCCEAHDRHPVPLPVSYAARAAALPETVQAAIRAAADSGIVTEGLSPQLTEGLKRIISDAERMCAAGRAESYGRTVEHLSPGWQGTLESLAATASRLENPPGGPAAASREETADM